MLFKNNLGNGLKDVLSVQMILIMSKQQTKL
jgi:hypothetical protein